MSFDIEFIACDETQTDEQQVNPFTGAAITIHGGALTESQRESIEDLLKTVRAVLDGEGDAFATRFSDGGAATIWFAGYHDHEIRGGTITIDPLSLELSSFVHAFLTSGGLAMSSMENGPGPVVPTQPLANSLGSRWPNVTVIDSPAALHDVLSAVGAKSQEKKKPWWQFW